MVNKIGGRRAKVCDPNQESRLVKGARPIKGARPVKAARLVKKVGKALAIKKSSAKKPAGAVGGEAARVTSSVGVRRPRLSAATAHATLLDVMMGSDKDHVRVSAAKIILARVAALEEQKMRKTKTNSTDQQNRQAALDAIARLLDELAATKAASPAVTSAVDQTGTPEPVDPRR